MVVQPPGRVSPTATGTSLESSRMGKRHQDEIAESLSPKDKSDLPHTKPISDTSAQDQVTNEQSASTQPILDNQKRSEDAVSAAKEHHKRSEDAVAAAKERFLARKKAKV